MRHAGGFQAFKKAAALTGRGWQSFGSPGGNVWHTNEGRMHRTLTKIKTDFPAFVFDFFVLLFKATLPARDRPASVWHPLRMTIRPGTILLAGATGYIGRAVATELLHRGYRVIAPVRRLPSSDTSTLPEGLDLRVAAFEDSAALTAVLDGSRPDAVISCIASRNGEPEDAWAVDYEANRRLLDAAAAAGARPSSETRAARA